MQPSEPHTIDEPVPGCARWSIQQREMVASTQELARELPAWSAVVADAQQAGRGQRRRKFVSDSGGLYLTAVVPLLTEPLRGRGFSLAAGWAVRAALLQLGAGGVRLRWPNDVMIDARKVGGILVEQAGRDTLLVGVGLNVTNHPWFTDPTLRDNATSLEECWPVLPARHELMAAILREVHRAHQEFEQAGLAGMVTRLNQCWGASRPVELEMQRESGTVRGVFRGISSEGDVEIAVGGNWIETVPAHHIARLREI